MGNLIYDPEYQRNLRNAAQAVSMGGPRYTENAGIGNTGAWGRSPDQPGVRYGTTTPPLRNPPAVVGNTMPVPVGQPTGPAVGMSQAEVAAAQARAAADAAAGPQASAQAQRSAAAAQQQQAAYNTAGRGGRPPVPPPNSGQRVPHGRGLVPYNQGSTKFMDRAAYRARGAPSWLRNMSSKPMGLGTTALVAPLAIDAGANIVSDVGQTFGGIDDDIAPGDTRVNIYDTIEDYGTWGVPDALEMPLRALSQELGFDTFNIDTLLENKRNAEYQAAGGDYGPGGRLQEPAASLRDYQESTTDINEALLDRTGMPQGIEGLGGRGLYIKNTYNDPANVAGRAEDQAKRDAEAAIVQQRRDDLAEAVDLGKFRTAGPKTIEERRSNLANEAIDREYKQALGGVKDQKLLLAMRKARSAEDKDIAINLQKRGTGKNFRVLDQGAASAASMLTSKRVSDLLREGEDPWTSPDGTMVRVAAKTLLENELATTHGFMDRFTQLWRDRGYLNDPEITPEMFTSGDIYIDQNRNIRVGDRVIKPDNPQVAQILQFLQRMAGVTE